MKITATKYSELKNDPQQYEKAHKLYKAYLSKTGNNLDDYAKKHSEQDHAKAFDLMMSYTGGEYSSENWYYFETTD